MRRSGLIISLIVTIAGLALAYLTIGRPLRNASYDLPFALFRESTADTNVVIVQLDDRSYQELGQNPAAFARSLHAQLIQALGKAGARAIIFDILFFDRRAAAAENAAFVAASTNFGPVVLAAAMLTRNQNGIRETKPELAEPPLDQLPWGLAALTVQGDRAPRLHNPGTERFPSLSWRALELLNPGEKPEPREKIRWLNYYAPHPFPRISFCDIILNPSNFAELIHDKTIFVGRATEAGYAGEEKEQFRSPWTRIDDDFIYGVEVHALTFANLLRKDWLDHAPVLELCVILLSGLAAGYFLPLGKPLPALGVAIILMGLIFAAGCIVQLYSNLWFAWMIPVTVQVPLAFAAAILVSSVNAYVEVKNLEHSLALHLSPERARQLARRRELLRPGAQTEVVSILFTDIQNFSLVCDRTRPGELIPLLNQYFESVLPCIKNTQGTVLKLIGDSVFAMWNAPEPQPNHAELACRAALLLRENLVHFEAENESLRLRTRVGLHTGKASVGNFGSRDRFDYTAMGPAVNLASRLEGLNKYLGTDILVSDDVLEQIHNSLVTRALGHFRFKGLDRVIKVHELIGSAEVAEVSRPWRKKFSEALRLFCDAEFGAATVAFGEVLALRPNDGPSRFYLERAVEYQKNPPREWFAEIRMDEK